MNNEIYTITALTKDGEKGRCFGFFFNESEARTAAINNYADMQECLYSYLVIEKQSDGIHPTAIVVQWYKWVGEHSLSENEGGWVECSFPKNIGFESIINWNGIG